MPLPLLAASFTLAALLVLLLAERSKDARLRAWSKLSASTGFVVAGLTSGALETGPGRWLLLGLVLAFVGDACLLSRRKGWFLAGLVAFLLGHLAYVGAFVARGLAPEAAGWALLALAVPAAVVLRWLWPRAGELRGPVVAYVAVITAMVAAALGAYVHGASPWIPVGALLFYLSDLCVARERFVAHALVNQVVGLPLYYAAQLVLALAAT
jgi:uncharacterized membrane protein YhhN